MQVLLDRMSKEVYTLCYLIYTLQYCIPSFDGDILRSQETVSAKNEVM